jgi:nucleoside-diphosphate-sugar epimerase
VTSRAQSVVVLGGSWFLGWAMVEALLERGHRVATVNRGRSPVCYSAPVKRVIADRQDPAVFASVVRKIKADCLVDLTAYRATDTRAVVDVCRDRLLKFIHISTLSVYRWPFPCPVDESWPLERDSLNSYGFHKAECERVLCSEPVTRIPWTILRLPAIYGPRDPLSRERYFYRHLIEEKPVIVPIKPFLCQNVFVRDAVEAVCWVIENPRASGRIYNVGGHPFTLEKYLELMGGLVGREPMMVRSSGKVLEAAGADVRKIPYFFEGNLVLETRRVSDEIGFEAAFSLDMGLSLTLKWLSVSPDVQVSDCWGLPWEGTIEAPDRVKYCMTRGL